jgi:eukaryotic-like serine/threonine-protein kinase
MRDPFQPAAPQPDSEQGKNHRPSGLKYRCPCGSEFDVASTLQACPDCGAKLPRQLANNPEMTLSFCSVSLDETTELNLRGVSASARAVLKATTPLRTGQKLGHFVLQEPLGEGGMGAVYRALDTSLQRYVAVKVLRDERGEGSTASNSRNNDRLRREAVSQARLNHPRVVTIYYVGREEEEPFLAMELLAGPTLQQRLEDGPLPYHEWIEYAMQVIDALEAADQSGLVHGDIKPSNLLMASPGNIKLSDFGLARRSGAATEDGSVSGTPNYLAPELLDGEAPDRRTDMYALGVTLFELAFGRRPFELSGTTLREQLVSHRTAEIVFPARWPNEIPEGLRPILQRLLEKDPGNRYQTFAALRSDLQRVRPIGSTLAGRPARLIAWMVDMVILGALQIPFLVPNGIVSVGVSENDWEQLDTSLDIVNSTSIRWFLGVVAMMGWIIVPFLSLWWDLKRYRTPGRYLMQLRVVDRYGLPPSRRVIVIRNLLRYASFWTGVIFGLPVVLGFFGAKLIDDIAGLVWLVLDSLLIFGPLRRTIHDRICDTHVVLDERSTQQAGQTIKAGTTIHVS